MIIAKPVVDKKFWILQKDDKKVGNVEACDGGYQVKIDNTVTQYKSIKMVEKVFNIEFLTVPKTKPVKKIDHEVHGIQTKRRAYNPGWSMNVKFNSPIAVYTSDKSSKSYLAAGWFKIKKGRHWAVHQDPKLILLERYPFKGPFHTKEEVENG